MSIKNLNAKKKTQQRGKKKEKYKTYLFIYYIEHIFLYMILMFVWLLYCAALVFLFFFNI